ncbi:MAG TPA: phage protease [Longimicrobiales bacterium]
MDGVENGLAIARSATTVDAVPEWVQLLPAGTFKGQDGRGPYEVPDPEAVIQLTRARAGGNDLPIDFGHALDQEGLAGAAAPAAGWIVDLEARAGEIWGRVAWTPEGERSVRAREYRFLSPVFFHDTQGTVKYIARAGLTNRPNLHLKAINAQHNGGTMSVEQTERMKIEDLLGLAPGTLEEEGRREAHATEIAERIGPVARAVCANLGITHEAFIKSMEG